MNKKMNGCRKVTWFIVSSVLTVAGFIVIPPLIKKYGDKFYKKSLNAEELDFDDMGPEIVPFNDDATGKE